MKKTLFFLLTFLFLFHLPADASQTVSLYQESDPTQDLGNLVFYPHAHKFLLSAELQSSATSDGTVSDNTGDLSNSVLTFTRIGVAGQYGIIDRLRVGISADQLVEQDNLVVSQSDGSATDQVSRGLSDPNLFLSYRAVQNFRQRFFVDANLEVSTSFSPRILAIASQTGTSQSGNNRTGAWVSTLSIPLYWLLAHNELEFAPEISHNYGGRQQGTNQKNSKSIDPHWYGDFVLRDRVHLTDSFFLEPTLVVNIEHSYTSYSREAIATKHGLETPFFVSPQLNIGFTVSAWCLINFLVTYEGYNSISTPNSGNARDTETSNTVFDLRSSFTF